MGDSYNAFINLVIIEANTAPLLHLLAHEQDDSILKQLRQFYIMSMQSFKKGLTLGFAQTTSKLTYRDYRNFTVKQMLIYSLIQLIPMMLP